MPQKILVTGAAGFIGFHLCKRLLSLGEVVVGIDNINDYYDPELKYARLFESGIAREDIQWFKPAKSIKFPSYRFIRMNLEDKKELSSLCQLEQFDIIINLAAQAGVRYSIENPDAYIQSNIVGFLNILEVAKTIKVKHLIYASSSSVYGLNESVPFSTNDNVDHPVSLYAATKKSNELMAHSYSHLYNIPSTGLRFFTVYGPWGRPDMAMFLFTEAIENDRPIKVFNYGKMERDFTYIDDIVEGILRIVKKSIDERIERKKLYKIYNIGHNSSLKLLDFIKEIEINLGKEAKKTMMEIQPGDVERTWANVDPLIKDYDYKPNTSIKTGVKEFVDWYKIFYNKKGDYETTALV